MDNSFSMGGLIPLWILGAPFLAAVISFIITPKAPRSEAGSGRLSQPSPPVQTRA